MLEGLYKGNTHKFNASLNEDITDWKIRCEIADNKGNSVKVATENTGGSDEQIEIINASLGTIRITVASGLTTDFEDDAIIEINVTDDNDETYTILQDDIKFKKTRINWSEPS